MRISSLPRLLAVGAVTAVAVQLVLGVVTGGLGPAAVAAGTAHAVVVGLLAAVTLRPQDRPGPADVVTIVRSMLATGVTSLVVAALLGGAPVPAWWVVGLGATAVLLDAADGPVARRTGTASPAGARFDVESDALLVLVLAFAVAADHGWWLIVLGLPRYLWGVLQLALPRLRAPLPPRRGRRETGAVQMLALVLATIPGAPQPAVVGGLALVGVLVVVSFALDTRATMVR